MDESVRIKLRATSWLPLVNGTAVAPENCVCTEGLESLVEELRKCGAEIAHKQQLESAITDSPAWSKTLRHLCPDGAAIIELIGKAMLHVGGYAVGQTVLSHISGEQFQNIFRKSPCHLMPVIAVIASIKQHLDVKGVDDAIHMHILEPLQTRLTDDRYLAVLQHLSHQPHSIDSEDPADLAFDAYLREAAELIPVESLLGQIKLRNRRGEYVSPDCLTTSTLNVDQKHTLDPCHATILADVLRSVPLHQGQPPATDIRKRIPDETEIEAGSDILSNVISVWQMEPDVPANALAALVAVLGARDGYPKLYEKLHPDLRKIENMWSLLGITEGLEHSRHRFCLRVAEKKTIPVLNLRGIEFLADVSKVPDSFFDPLQGMQEAFRSSDGGLVFQLTVRPCNLQKLSTDQKLEILLSSINDLRKIVWRSQSTFDTAWERLTLEDQLELSVAQRQILGSCSTILESQLGVEANADARLSQLSAMLQQYYDAHTDQLKASSAGSDLERTSANEARNRIIKQIRRLLVSDPNTQQGVINEIIKRLTAQSYNATSVPFEIFQNSDDAVTQLRRHLSAEQIERARPQSLINTVRVESDADQCKVVFFHWGRGINQYRLSDHVEKRYRRDLEKMLVLQGSGKAHETGVTGHFGLGFKSVFFVSDEPKVFSGTKSRFVVKSGVFPDKLQKVDEDRLRGVLQVLESREVPTGTAIELSLRKEHSPSSVLSRFRKFAGYLVLFSKTIRTLEFVGESPDRVEVSLDKLDDFVSVTSPLNANGQRAILFRLKGGPPSTACGDNENDWSYRNVLLHIDSLGLPAEPFSLSSNDQDQTPEIWVTTPAFEHCGSAAIVLNADLQVNPGRSRLRDTEYNTELLHQIGIGFGELLVGLFEKTTANWPAIRKQLSLSDTEITARQFWESFWRVCLPIAKRLPSDPIRCILFGEGLGLSRLMREMPIIPTGLPAPFDEPVKLYDIRKKTAGLLASRERWDLLSRKNVKEKAWLRLLWKLHRSGPIVSTSTIDDLRACDLKDFTTSVTSIGMSEAIEEMTGTNFTVTPSFATILGQIFDDRLLPVSDQSDDAKNVRTKLANLCFYTDSTSGNLVKASQGLVSVASPEEELLAKFAPTDRIISKSHDLSAVGFFCLCRRSLDFNISEVVSWCLTADDGNRPSVLRYFASGYHAHLLQSYFKECVTEIQSSWLADVVAVETASLHLSEHERNICFAILNLRRPQIEVWPREVLLLKFKPQAVFNAITDWWNSNKESLFVEHDRLIYPAEYAPRLNLDATQSELVGTAAIRREWLTLFIRGQLFRIGQRDAQHRGFLNQFFQSSIWEMLVEGQNAPQQWFDGFDSYLEHSTDEQTYFHWMNQILGFYQLSRWLPQYASAFQGVSRPEANLQNLSGIEGVANLRSSQIFGGSTGFDAPPCRRTLGLGAHFVLREVLRQRRAGSEQYVTQRELAVMSFVPSSRVRKLFQAITGDEAFDARHNHGSCSKAMYETCKRYVADPTFDNCFDIPFRMLTWAKYSKERTEILGSEYSLTSEMDEDAVDSEVEGTHLL